MSSYQNLVQRRLLHIKAATDTCSGFARTSLNSECKWSGRSAALSRHLATTAPGRVVLGREAQWVSRSCSQRCTDPDPAVTDTIGSKMWDTHDQLPPPPPMFSNAYCWLYYRLCSVYLSFSQHCRAQCPNYPAPLHHIHHHSLQQHQHTLHILHTTMSFNINLGHLVKSWSFANSWSQLLGNPCHVNHFKINFSSNCSSSSSRSHFIREDWLRAIIAGVVVYNWSCC